MAARLIFPHQKALGLKVGEDLSPDLVEKLAYLGTKLPSFRDAHEALGVLLRTQVSLKRVERHTERIGAERVMQREAEIATWSDLPLMQRDQAPPGVKAPEVAAVLADGGRLQLCEENADARSKTRSATRPNRPSVPPSSAKSHWHEYKAGVLHSLRSEAHAEDPCRDLPEVYLRPEKIDKLAREITTLAAREEPSGPAVPLKIVDPTADLSTDSSPDPSTPLVPPAEVIPHGYTPPEVIDRDVVASRHDSRACGRQLAARAWMLGLFAAPRKAFVGDGSGWIWTEWERYFKAYWFVPILDSIHALTHIYAAAMAGRNNQEGWQIYRRWITWTWHGEVAQVIAELATRQQELGLPTAADTSPRRLVSETLTYLQNQQSRMNDPAYRKQGLPITSAHMESTVKQINRRVKGSEKYWSEAGAEDLLQLTADHLSTSQPLTEFWRTRPDHQSGTRTYHKSAT